FAGALMWWIHLPRMLVLAFWPPRFQTLQSMAPMLAAAAVTTLILVLSFNGTGDTRNRASIYILLYPVLGYLNFQLDRRLPRDQGKAKVTIRIGTVSFIAVALSFSIYELTTA